jgi:uncharacterized membrane protein YgdD (TMEM256/DUF423 family)
MRSFLVLGVVGPAVYLFFPVVGPVYAYGHEGGGLQFGDYWPHLVAPPTSTPGPRPFDTTTARNCMPSLHTAWALALFFHSRTGPAWLRWGGGIWLAGTLTATLGFGFHYGVDLLAGAVLALTVETVLTDPDRGWSWARALLAATGTVLFVGLLLSYRFLSVTMAHYPDLSGPLLIGSVAALGFLCYRTWYVRIPHGSVS